MSVLSPVVATWSGTTRRIYLKQGVSEYYPIEDIYHEYRNERSTNEDFRKWEPLLKAEGNIPKGGGAFTPRYVVLLDDTKIVPYDETLRLDQLGDMITDDPDVDPTLYDTSTLTVPKVIFIKPSEAEIIQLNSGAIEYSSFGGGVTIDMVNGSPGTTYNIGTIENPVNNIPDALLIANTRGFNKLYLVNDITINGGNDLAGFMIEGRSHINTLVTIEDSAIVDDINIYNCHITGTLDGGVDVTFCVIENLVYMNGHIHRSSLSGIISLDGGKDAYIANCSQLDTDVAPEINMGGSGQDLMMPGYNGLLKITNLTGDNNVYVGLDGGDIVLDSTTVTSGTVLVAGIGALIDEFDNPILTGTWNNNVTIINRLVNRDTVASAVAYEIGAEIQYSSYGGGVTVDTTTGVSGTAYNIGTIENPVNNLTDAVAIANTRGFNTLFINESMTLDNGTDMIDFKIIGKSRVDTEIMIDPSAICEGIVIERCSVLGTLDGNTQIKDCVVGNLTYVNGHIMDSGLYGTIILAGSEDAYMVNCSTIDVSSIPIIDMGGSGQNVFLSDWSGGIKFKNMTGANKIGIQIDGGRVYLEDTITNGFVGVTGIGELIDNSTGTCTVDINSLFNAERLNAATWDAVYIDTTNGYSGTAFPIGTRTKQSNNIVDAISIANSNNLKTIRLRGKVDLPQTTDDWTFIGVGSSLFDTINLNNQNINRCRFGSLTVSGTMTATDVQFIGCNVKDVSGMNALIRNSSLQGNITMGGPGSVLMGQNLGVRGNTLGAPAVVNMVGVGRLFQANIEGAVQFSNADVDSFIEVGLNNGVVILDPTCTGGYASFTGVGGNLINYSTMTVTNGLLTESSITDAVLDENIFEHTISGTLGSTVGKIKKETGLIPALV
jgi:hypothetical protein